MLELRRIRAGIFKENSKQYPSVNLYDLEKAIKDENLLKKIIMPGEEALEQILPSVQIEEKSVTKLLTGKPIYKEDLEKELKAKTGKFIAFHKDKLIGIYKKVEDNYILAKPKFVFQPLRG